jgi:hypothetical protein
VVHDNLTGGRRTTRNRLVPYCMYLDPELAQVGFNESQARRSGIGYRLLTLPMAAVLRTRTLSEPRGFMKMLLAADSDGILGFTHSGPRQAADGRRPDGNDRPCAIHHDAERDLRPSEIAEGLTFLLRSTPISPAR